jgi:hypothetical protein
VTSCSLVEVYTYFGGTYSLNLQVEKQDSDVTCENFHLFRAGYLFVLDPEDGGSTFLQTIT